MITRALLLRELQQFVQVLAVVLFHKRDPGAAQDALAEGVQTVTGVTLDALHAMDREAVLTLAAWLYEAAVEAGGPYPFDVHARIAALRGTAA